MTSKIVPLIALSILVLTAASFSPFAFKQASAHLSRTFGNYVVEVGWNNEPVYNGLMNAVQITVKKGSGDSAIPVINALKNMQISVMYGTVKKQLDFEPSAAEDGQYVASILPTRVGSYSIVMKGSIESQNIDTEIPLDDVASADTISFPPNPSGNMPEVGQLGTIIDQLTNDVEEAKKNSDMASQSVLNAAKSFQNVKDSTDRLYMISMIGIGIGIAGVVIAVIAITRNKQPNS